MKEVLQVEEMTEKEVHLEDVTTEREAHHEEEMIEKDLHPGKYTGLADFLAHLLTIKCVKVENIYKNSNVSTEYSL